MKCKCASYKKYKKFVKGNNKPLVTFFSFENNNNKRQNIKRH